MVLTRSARESISNVSPLLRFSVLCAISLVIWWSPLTSSFALALRDDQYTHILLILPVRVTLLYLEKGNVLACAPPSAITCWAESPSQPGDSATPITAPLCRFHGRA